MFLLCCEMVHAVEVIEELKIRLAAQVSCGA
jgi:hypothetical protein